LGSVDCLAALPWVLTELPWVSAELPWVLTHGFIIIQKMPLGFNPNS